jgi:hypothetical protein
LRRVRKRAGPRRGWVGLRGVHAHHLRGSDETLKRAGNLKNRQSKKGSQGIHSPISQWGASRAPTGMRHHNAPT